jgi:tRNA-splicing ligase RtcB (3'-phosphate/5'-hydroxy nucleic acid ligase)
VSLKHRVERVGPNQYVLPRLGDMRVEATAFLSEELFDRSEADLWTQAKQAASYAGVTGAYLMPDAHVGFGVPVGSVVVTDGTVIQAASGYDISCGVLVLRVPDLSAAQVADRKARSRWVAEVEKRIATGIGSKRPALAPKLPRSLVDEVLHHGAQALGVSADRCERQFIPVPEDLDLSRIARAYDKAYPQLGSLGGGNHFIELQVDRHSGEVWVMVHCGSRGYGWQTANHFFFEGARARGMPQNQREASFLFMDEPLGREYWAYHNSAVNYAVANRHLIASAIREALQAAFGVDAEVYYEISHNLVQEEPLLLPDGSTKRGFVHRKGATRAFPAGHPGLSGSAWEDSGHPCLVPGSMYEGAAILFPLPGAQRSGYSVNHGSGRQMGRGVARRALVSQQQAIDTEMREVRRVFAGVEIAGIVGNTPHTPLDECARVYKSIDDVLGVLTDEGIAHVAARLFPVANIKGLD